MSKRDTVRNINKLTNLLNAKVAISYSIGRSGCKATSIRVVDVENLLDGVWTFSHNGNVHIVFHKGIRIINKAGTQETLRKSMIKYLFKIGVVVESGPEQLLSIKDPKLKFDFQKYKYWCDKYNLAFSEKAKQFLEVE